MGARGSRLQPGHLLTGEERLHLRLLHDDLTRQLDRATDELTCRRLQRQIASVEMDRAEDRRTRPRRKKAA